MDNNSFDEQQKRPSQEKKVCNQKLTKSDFIMWGIVGNALFFMLATKNIPHIFNFDLVASVLCAICYSGYAHVFLRFSKWETIQMFVYGILFGIILPICFSIILLLFIFN